MADYIIARDDGEYLQHFGAKGMKWGVRRFQNEDGTLTALGKERYGYHGERSARGTKHDLNKLDREQTNAKARYDYYDRKAKVQIGKANKKLRKAKRKGDEDAIIKAKAKLNEAKNSKNVKNAADYKKLYDRSKALTDKIIKQSLKKGYSIHSRDVLRSVNRGHSAASNSLALIGSIALTATTGVTAVYANNQFAPGKHYTVRDDGMGIQTHRSRRFSYEPHRRR